MTDVAQLIKKRQRVEGDEDRSRTLNEEDKETTSKRHKSYDQVIIEEDEQQEISDSSATTASPASDDDDDRESVFKHLLEASDDELGLPTKREEDRGDLVASDENNYYDFEGGLNDFGGGNLWEIEDEAANYYALMQSEVFM